MKTNITINIICTEKNAHAHRTLGMQMDGNLRLIPDEDVVELTPYGITVYVASTTFIAHTKTMLIQLPDTTFSDKDRFKETIRDMTENGWK